MIKQRSKNVARNAPRQLLRAAAHVFASNGFDGAATRAIANRAGVNIALIAYHFGGKEGLYDAVLADWAAGLCAAIQRDLARVEEPAARTEAILGVFLRYALIEAPGVAALALRESVATETSPTARRTAAALGPVVELLDALLPLYDAAMTSGTEWLGLMLRLSAPMPSLDGGGVEGYHRARTRALALFRIAAPATEPAAPPAAGAPREYRLPTPTPMDFVD